MLKVILFVTVIIGVLTSTPAFAINQFLGPINSKGSTIAGYQVNGTTVYDVNDNATQSADVATSSLTVGPPLTPYETVINTPGSKTEALVQNQSGAGGRADWKLLDLASTHLLNADQFGSSLSGDFGLPAGSGEIIESGGDLGLGVYTANDLLLATNDTARLDISPTGAFNFEGNPLSAGSLTLTTPLAPPSGGLGISTVPANGDIPIGNGTNYTAATLTAGTGVAITNGAGSVTVANTGVTSVGLSLPGIFSVTGSPVTTTGTLTGALATQNANLLFAGPSSGAAAAPTFRALTNADMPASGAGSGTVTSVGLALPSIFSVTGSPVTSSGTLTGALATQTANLVFSGPSSGAATAPTFRSLVNADFPTSGVTASTYGGASAIPEVTVNAQGIVTAATTVAPSVPVGDITGILPVANGGTGLSTAASNSVLLGDGTGALYSVASVASTILTTDSNGKLVFGTAVPNGTTGTTQAAADNTVKLATDQFVMGQGFTANALSNPMTTLGDMISGGASGAPTRLAGNTSTTREWLLSAGTGTAANAPVFATLAAGDIPGTLNPTVFGNSSEPSVIIEGASAPQSAALPADTQLYVTGSYLSGSTDQVYGRAFVGADGNQNFGTYIGTRRDASGTIHLVLGTRVAGTDKRAVDVDGSGNLNLLAGALQTGGTTRIDPNGNATLGTGLFTGTLTPESTLHFSTTVSYPGNITSGAYIYDDAGSGLTMYGAGSSYDIDIVNKIGNGTILIPTGTSNVILTGTVTAGNGSVSGVVGKIDGSDATLYSTTSYASHDGLYIVNENTSGNAAGFLIGSTYGGANGAASIAALQLTSANTATELAFQTRTGGGIDTEGMRLTDLQHLLIATTTDNTTSALQVGAVTDSTSTTTGAEVIAGGLGVGLNMNVGLNVTAQGGLFQNLSAGGSNTSLEGKVSSTASAGTLTGTAGVATGASGQTVYGIYGSASGGTTNYAGVFVGDVDVTGKILGTQPTLQAIPGATSSVDATETWVPISTGHVNQGGWLNNGTCDSADWIVPVTGYYFLTGGVFITSPAVGNYQARISLPGCGGSFTVTNSIAYIDKYDDVNNTAVPFYLHVTNIWYLTAGQQITLSLSGPAGGTVSANVDVTYLDAYLLP